MESQQQPPVPAQPLPRGIGAPFARAFFEAARRTFGSGAQVELSGLSAYDRDTPRFAYEVLGVRQWEFQLYAERALWQHRRVLVYGPRKNGKTFMSGATALSFMSTAPTICLTTSGGMRQVEHGLWQKIRSLHQQARIELPGEPGHTKWEVAPEWYALGFSAKDPGKVLGFHASVELGKDAEFEGLDIDEALKKLRQFRRRAERVRRRQRLLLILDEVFEIDAEVLLRLSGSMIGQNVYVLAIGNPTLDPDADHPAMRWMRPDSGFHRIHVSSQELPDPSWEPQPADKCFHWIPPEVQDPTWRAREIKDHGIASPYCRCFIFGLPARADLDWALIPRRALEGCAELELAAEGSAEELHIGADIGAGGPDPSVAYLWRAGTLCARHEWRSQDLMETAGVIAELARAWGPSASQPIPARNIHIDSIGVGRGVADRLRQIGLDVDAVDFGRRPRGMWRELVGQLHFPNIRSEVHWCFRRLLEERRICVPRSYSEVWRQSSWYSYEHHAAPGGTLVQLKEAKEDIRERFGRSPDDLDAALLGLCRAPRARVTVVESMAGLRERSARVPQAPRR